MSHSFISYVRDDADVVGYIAEILDRNAVPYWLDKNDIDPGLRWKDAIRQAIESGNFFIAMFSRNWQEREASYANEELTLAIEQLRLRPTNRAWFIAVRLDDCEIPDRSIGGGETLRDLQYINLPADGWSKGLTKLLRTLGVYDPALDVGEPLGTGLPPNVAIVSGKMVVERSQPTLPQMHGLVYTITGGWVTRTKDSHMLAYLQTQAPIMQLQSINEKFGLASFYAISTDGFISDDPKNPNTFGFSTEHEFPAGTKMWDISTMKEYFLPVPMTTKMVFTAKGLIKNKEFNGVYTAKYRIAVGQMGTIDLVAEGSFDLRVAPIYDPDPQIANR